MKMVVDDYRGVEMERQGNGYVLTWLQASDENNPQWIEVSTIAHSEKQAQEITHELLNHVL